MQYSMDSLQCGMSISKVVFIFVLSSTEYGGRVTGEGNSLLWHGVILQFVFPQAAAISTAKSYQEHAPSFEKWYMPSLPAYTPASIMENIANAIAGTADTVPQEEEETEP